MPKLWDPIEIAKRQYSYHLALDVITHIDKINLWKDFANILAERNLFENSKQFFCFNNHINNYIKIVDKKYVTS